MNNNVLAPQWLKPAAITALFGTISVVLLMLVSVIFGITDPKPLGTLTVESNQAIELTADRTDHIVYQSVYDAVQCPCTLEVVLRQRHGAPTERYGVWWSNSRETTIAAINGNSYYAVFDKMNYLIEWQRFPWLLPHGESNRLRVDLSAYGNSVLRLNDEVAGSFIWSGHSPIQFGLYLEINQGAATITVDRVRIWSTK